MFRNYSSCVGAVISPSTIEFNLFHCAKNKILNVLLFTNRFLIKPIKTFSIFIFCNKAICFGEFPLLI